MGSLRVRVIGACVAVMFVAVSQAGAAYGPDRATVSYRVVNATVNATLSFSGGRANSQERGVASLRGAAPIGGAGSLGARGGSVRFRVTSVTTERVRIRERANASSPYVEQTCGNLAARRNTATLTFRRVGTRVQIRWSFPRAQLRRCPGPRVAPPVTRMVSVVPAARFRASRFTLRLTGSARFSGATHRGTYSWRVAVTLAQR